MPNLNIFTNADRLEHNKKDWLHLKHVLVPEETAKSNVGILISIKVSDAHDVLEVRKAQQNAGRGVLTPLGWIITGANDVETWEWPIQQSTTTTNIFN